MHIPRSNVTGRVTEHTTHHVCNVIHRQRHLNYIWTLLPCSILPSAYLKIPDCITAESDSFPPYTNRQHVHTLSPWTPETSPHLDLRRQRGPALNTLSLPGHTMYHHITSHLCQRKRMSDVPSICHQTAMTSIFGEVKPYPYLQRSKTYLCVSRLFNLSVAFRKVWKGHDRPSASPAPSCVPKSTPTHAHPVTTSRGAEALQLVRGSHWQGKARHSPSEHLTIPSPEAEAMTRPPTPDSSPPTLIFKEGWRTLKLEDVRAHICQPAFHREIKRLAPHHPALEWLVSLSLRVTPRSSGLFLFMVHSSITLTLFLNFFQRKTLIYIRKSSSRLGEGGSTQLSIPLPPSQANLMTCF